MRTKFFFNLGILLSSFDSLPFFKGFSMYSPYLSILCFTIYYLNSTPSPYQYKFQPRTFLILLFILSTVLISLFKGLFLYHDIKGFINYFIQIVIAVILYKSFNHYFQSLPIEKYTDIFSKSFITYSFPVIAIGIFEIFVFPIKSIYSSLMSILSWRYTMDRIQLASGEPAWASRFILTFISILPFAHLKKNIKLYLTIISIILLIFTGSTLGISCVLIYYIITYFKRKNFGYLLIATLFFIISAPIIYTQLSDYTKARIEVLSNLGSSDIETIAVNAGSGSVMARLGNPLLAMYMGTDNLLFGVGGGYYYKYHYEYLSKIFPNALWLSNINETGTTPKNLFARIFAETGIIGIVVFISVLIWLYKRKIHNNFLRGIFTAMILLTLNFDSLFHIYPLLLFCFLYNFPPTNKRHPSIL